MRSDWLLIVSSTHSDKSKRRTKTVKKSAEPRWNQTFMYSPVHRREFRERMLELTVWDQARVREEESQFLGEVRTQERRTKCVRFFCGRRLCCVLLPWLRVFVAGVSLTQGFSKCPSGDRTPPTVTSSQGKAYWLSGTLWEGPQYISLQGHCRPGRRTGAPWCRGSVLQ